MTEVLFYHLTLKPLEDVLPGLLETCLQRDWRVVVQAGSAERVTALDSLLWSYRDDSFLPHGTASDGEADRQLSAWLVGLVGVQLLLGAYVRHFHEGVVWHITMAVVVFGAQKPILDSFRHTRDRSPSQTPY